METRTHAELLQIAQERIAERQAVALDAILVISPVRQYLIELAAKMRPDLATASE